MGLWPPGYGHRPSVLGRCSTSCNTSATLCSTDVAWPHEPAVVDYYATEGRSWRLRLSRDGAWAARLGAPAASEDTVDASARGTASDLVLFFYGRIPPDSPKLKLDGDRRIFDQLIAWDPSV